jgi:hypothetical protein
LNFLFIYSKEENFKVGLPPLVVIVNKLPPLPKEGNFKVGTSGRFVLTFHD